ncbi:MAG: LON peptidase substrate-binding domain-containing protein [Gammaproteobacteria bacterium]
MQEAIDKKYMTLNIPLFPLNVVLFPGGPLPLRIFEPRYLDMISDCLKHNTGIGVVLIRNGREVGDAAETHTVGTLCTISYWNRRQDGLLGITLTGEQRFRILTQKIEQNKLIRAEVELLDALPRIPMSEKYQHLVNVLQKILPQLEPPFTTMPVQYDNLDWVTARLIELLPFPLPVKQALLEEDDPQQRVAKLHGLLHDFDEI